MGLFSKFTRPPVLAVPPGEEVIVVGTEYHEAACRKIPRRGPMNLTLVREPRNRHDRRAVMVQYEGTTVGYLSTARAVRYAPIMDRLGRDLQAQGHREGAKLFVSMPAPKALSQLVRALG